MKAERKKCEGSSIEWKTKKLRKQKENIGRKIRKQKRTKLRKNNIERKIRKQKGNKEN